MALAHLVYRSVRRKKDEHLPENDAGREAHGDFLRSALALADDSLEDWSDRLEELFRRRCVLNAVYE